MPITGAGGLNQTSGDARYVKKTGDTMSGDLTFATTSIGPILTDGTNQWRVTVDATGHLVTTQIVVVTPTTGNPIGPGMWLWLTYA